MGPSPYGASPYGPYPPPNMYGAPTYGPYPPLVGYPAAYPAPPYSPPSSPYPPSYSYPPSYNTYPPPYNFNFSPTPAPPPYPYFRPFDAVIQQQVMASLQAKAADVINALASFSTTPDLRTCLYSINVLFNLATTLPSLNTTQRQTLCSAGQACGQLAVRSNAGVSTAALVALIRLCTENTTSPAAGTPVVPAPGVYPPPATGGLSTQQALWVAGNLSVTASITRSLLLKNSNLGLSSFAVTPQMAVGVVTGSPAFLEDYNNMYFPSPISAMFMPVVVMFGGWEFKAWCARDRTCSAQTNIQLTAVYYANPAPWLAVASNFPFTNQPGIPASSFTVVSGIMDIQMGSYKSDVPVCNATTMCSVSVYLPVNPSLWSANKSTACVRMQPTQPWLGGQSPLTAVMERFYSVWWPQTSNGSAPLYVSCGTSELGKIMAVQFDAPRPPPPWWWQSPPPPSPEPLPSWPNAPNQPPTAPDFPTQPPAPLAPTIPPQAPTALPMSPQPPVDPYSYYDGAYDGTPGSYQPSNAVCLNARDPCCGNSDGGVCRMDGCNPHAFCVPKTNRESHAACCACEYTALMQPMGLINSISSVLQTSCVRPVYTERCVLVPCCRSLRDFSCCLSLLCMLAACNNRTDQATCETDAFCSWGTGTSGSAACSLIPINHPCAPMTATACGASTVCTLRATCSGSCAVCDACQTLLYAQVRLRLRSSIRIDLRS